jgi:hypothetical protein
MSENSLRGVFEEELGANFILGANWAKPNVG